MNRKTDAKLDAIAQALLSAPAESWMIAERDLEIMLYGSNDPPRSRGRPAKKPNAPTSAYRKTERWHREHARRLAARETGR
jgi:hypothetical protein